MVVYIDPAKGREGLRDFIAQLVSRGHMSLRSIQRAFFCQWLLLLKFLKLFLQARPTSPPW